MANPDEASIDAPENRKGDALRAGVRSTKTGDTWRFVSDDVPLCE